MQISMNVNYGKMYYKNMKKYFYIYMLLNKKIIELKN